MKVPTKRPWGPDIDATTIPDDVLAYERARRNSARVKVRKGAPKGQPWTPARRKAQLLIQRKRATRLEQLEHAARLANDGEQQANEL